MVNKLYLDASEGGVCAQARGQIHTYCSGDVQQGLCGAFNNNVIKGAKALAEDYEQAAFVTIGKKPLSIFKNGYELFLLMMICITILALPTLRLLPKA